MEEAAAIRSVQMALNGNLTYSEITAILLCELQDTQDHELAQTLQKLHSMVRLNSVLFHHETKLRIISIDFK